MKVNRNQIKNYDIEKYVEWIVNLPDDLVFNISEWLRFKHIETYLSIRKYKSRIRNERFRKDNENAEYRFFYEKMLLRVKEEITAHDKTEQLFTFMVVMGLMERKNIEYLQAGGKHDYQLYIDKIKESRIFNNAYAAKEFIKTCFEVCKDVFLNDNRALFISEEERKEDKIKEYENKDFLVLDYLKNGLIYKPVFADDNIKCCQEIGELLFYKFLVSNEVQTESIKLNETTQREKLDKLKNIGVFDLDFFSVDPRRNGVSQRKQASFLASIIGGNETNIRNYLAKIRKEE